MECMTVLKEKDFQKQAISCGYDLEAHVVKSRSRSHKLLRIVIALLFVLVVLSFGLQVCQLAQMHQTERKTATLEAKVKELVATKELDSHIIEQLQRNTDQHNDEDKRRRRHAESPNFYITGTGTSPNGIFLWERIHNNFFRAIPSSDGQTEKIKILRAGTYFIFARIAMKGRGSQGSSFNYAASYETRGITLKRASSHNTNGEALVSSFLTQDERGAGYTGSRTTGADYPIDTVHVSGLFNLEQNDLIYVSKPESLLNDPNNEQYIVDKDKAQFGGFRISS